MSNASVSSVLEEIRGVFLFERGAGDEEYVSCSPPGHLLHLVTAGEVRQRCNGREYHLRRGDLLWYHDGELIEGRCLRTPWTFYSVVFAAPSLPPPEFAGRKARPAWPLARDLFAELLTAWRNDGKSETHRSLRCHAALSRLLLLHQPAQVRVPRAAPDAWPVRLWWNIENQARQNLGRAWTLADLASLASASPATVHRASLAAVGMPPVRRIKSLRLEMARGLLVYSGDGIAEIAARAGYERVNEFSRDMRKLFGMPPSKIREGKASQVDSPLRP